MEKESWEVSLVSIDELKLSDYNPREISEHDFKSLKSSIKRFGLVSPIVVNRRDKQVIGGHMRLRAARELGHKYVPVRYEDLSEREAKLLNLALNKIDGRWNRQKLEELIYDLSSDGAGDLNLTGFEDWELELYNPGEGILTEDMQEVIDNFEDMYGTDPDNMVLYFRFRDPEKFQKMRNLLAIGLSRECKGAHLYDKFKDEL